VCLVDTVDSLAEGYSPRQIALAKMAWKAMSMMGSPSSATFKLMVWDNFINNCPVALNAIMVAYNVFDQMLRLCKERWPVKPLNTLT